MEMEEVLKQTTFFFSYTIISADPLHWQVILLMQLPTLEAETEQVCVEWSLPFSKEVTLHQWGRWSVYHIQISMQRCKQRML
jgi:hypothetical protein